MAKIWASSDFILLEDLRFVILFSQLQLEVNELALFSKIVLGIFGCVPRQI